ncbi:MAG: hypothetical protein HQL24_04895 [Candidatus Omnitrophica bacterium]|nr:hypothetical protein [Candidatus Omnitrophota bacterium]
MKRLKQIVSIIILVAFCLTSILPPARAQEMPWMPVPGTMVNLSSAFMPAILKGITIHPEDPFKFDFIIHRGDQNFAPDQKQDVYTNLIKYFLASLAVPDENQWVNLSPYEKNRIVEEDFGLTEMGRDLLAQDYLLKQITSSLMFPESEVGKAFWNKVYKKAYELYGTVDVPVDTFNKVWIVPDNAVIYEKDNTAYVIENHLKVMLEEDYVALEHNAIKNAAGEVKNKTKNLSEMSTKVLNDVIIPALEKEVNEGKNFAPLRQVYSGMLLAAWYKRVLKESILAKVYADKSKVKGVDQKDPKTNQEIWNQYVKAFRKGVYNIIKEEYDPVSQSVIPKKYFSGGAASYATKAGDNFGKIVKRILGPALLNKDQAMSVQQEINDKDDIVTAEGVRHTAAPASNELAIKSADPLKIFEENIADTVQVGDQKNVLVLHGIQDLSKNNRELEGGGAANRRSVFEKLEMMMAFMPTLSTYTRRMDQSNRLVQPNPGWCGFGAILSKGTIVNVSKGDTGREPDDIYSVRTVNSDMNDMQSNFNAAAESSGVRGYTEVVVAEPVVSGLFFFESAQGYYATISKEQAVDAARKSNLPLYVINEEGEIHKADLKSSNIDAEEPNALSWEDINQHSFPLTDSQRAAIMKKQFKDSPFRNMNKRANVEQSASVVRDNGREMFIYMQAFEEYQRIKDEETGWKTADETASAKLGVKVGDQYQVVGVYETRNKLRHFIVVKGKGLFYSEEMKRVSLLTEHPTLSEVGNASGEQKIDDRKGYPEITFTVSNGQGVLPYEPQGGLSLKGQYIVGIGKNLEENMGYAKSQSEQEKWSESPRNSPWRNVFDTVYHIYGFVSELRKAGVVLSPSEEEALDALMEKCNAIVPLSEYRQMVHQRGLDEFVFSVDMNDLIGTETPIPQAMKEYLAKADPELGAKVAGLPSFAEWQVVRQLRSFFTNNMVERGIESVSNNSGKNSVDSFIKMITAPLEQVVEGRQYSEATRLAFLNYLEKGKGALPKEGVDVALELFHSADILRRLAKQVDQLPPNKRQGYNKEVFDKWEEFGKNLDRLLTQVEKDAGMTTAKADNATRKAAPFSRFSGIIQKFLPGTTRRPVGPIVRVTAEGLMVGDVALSKNKRLTQKLQEAGIINLSGEAMNDRKFIRDLKKSAASESDLLNFFEQRHIMPIKVPHITVSPEQRAEAEQAFSYLFNKIKAQTKKEIMPLLVDFLSKMPKERNRDGITMADRLSSRILSLLTSMEQSGKIPVSYQIISILSQLNHIVNEILRDVEDVKAIAPLMDAFFFETLAAFRADEAQQILNKLLVDWRQAGNKNNVNFFFSMAANSIAGEESYKWKYFVELSKHMKDQTAISFDGGDCLIQDLVSYNDDSMSKISTGKSPIFAIKLVNQKSGEIKRVLMKWIENDDISHEIIGAEISGVLNLPTYHVEKLGKSAAGEKGAWAMIEYREDSQLVAQMSGGGLVTPGISQVLSGTVDEVKAILYSLGNAAAASYSPNSGDAWMKHFLLTKDKDGKRRFMRIDQESMFVNSGSAVPVEKGDVGKFLAAIKRQGQEHGEEYVAAFKEGFDATMEQARAKKTEILNILKENLPPDSLEESVQIVERQLSSGMTGDKLVRGYGVDKAMATADHSPVTTQNLTDQKLTNGGIDLNAANLNLQIKRDGNGIPLPVSQQNLENIQIDGLVPVILDIRPAVGTLHLI